MKKQTQKIFSIFLLAVVLAAQLGLHLAHHHVPHKHSSSTVVSVQADSDQHCAVCGLDLFFAQELPSEFYFSFTPILGGKLEMPATSATSFSIIFSSDRAPPVC